MKWKIFIVTCDKIIDEYYEKDQKFSKDNWAFFNVSKNRLISDKDYEIINAIDIQGYEFLGKDWAESEVIYNIYNLDLFKDYDYIGIIHWDFDIVSPKLKTNRITENIKNILENTRFDTISFFPAEIYFLTDVYNVLMDERKPNCLFVKNSDISNPRSSLDYINTVIDNPIDLSLIDKKTHVPLCCSFISRRDIFNKIGMYIKKIKISEILKKFDTEKRHRFPGQLMERLVAMSILENDKNFFKMPLTHNFIGGKELNNTDKNGENY